MNDLVISLRTACVVFGGAFLMLMVLVCVSDSPGFAKDAKILAGVKPFPRDYDSGAMALRALRSCLQSLGIESSYERLVALSHATFLFIYDSTEAYEPLRDSCPIDLLAEVATSLGFVDAHWVVNKPRDEVVSLVKAEIDKGRPVLAPYIDRDLYHGFFIIAGYDVAKGIYYIQGAFDDTTYKAIKIPDEWVGPTLSPLGWARNPVFVLGERISTQAKRRLAEKGAIKAAIGLLEGGEVNYGVHPQELSYIGDQSSHVAKYGLPAYDLLLSDLGSEPLILYRDGNEKLNFGFLWRLDSQLGMLEHNRHYGERSLHQTLTLLPREDAMKFLRVLENCKKMLEDVRTLRGMFWDIVPEEYESAEEVASYINGSRSIVFKTLEDSALLDELKLKGFKVFNSPWGHVVVADSPEKRSEARLVARQLQVRDRENLHIMREIVERIGSTLGPRPRRKRSAKSDSP